MLVGKVRLVMNAPGRGELFIDDKKIDGVTHVEISTGVDQMNSICVKFKSRELEVDGPFDVTTIGDETRVFARAS